jgi:zinc resistance-associated protein
MIRWNIALLPALITGATLLGPSIGMAQQANAPTRNLPSAETMQRLEDGQLAHAKAMLKLTEPQEKLWAPIEEAIRSSWAQRDNAMRERTEKRSASSDALSLPDRLERASQAMAARADRMKTIAAAFKPFYAALSDEQKAVAGPALRELIGFGGHRGGGHHWSAARHAVPSQKG